MTAPSTKTFCFSKLLLTSCPRFRTAPLDSWAEDDSEKVKRPMKKWYYADSGRPVGPVAESEIKELVEAGVINSTTLIWCEGMSNWQPYSESVMPQNAERRSSAQT